MSKSVRLKQPFKSASLQHKISVILKLLLAVILIIFSVFPIIWVISAAFNPTGSLATQKLIPANPGFQNFNELLESQEFPFWRWFGNSIKISLITSIGSLSITTIAAYAFSRFRFKGRKTILKGIFLVQVFPTLLALVAVFLMISQVEDVIPFIGLNTHTALILVYLGGAMGSNIWLMKGYLDTVPRDIDESAMVDGATHWQIFTRLIIPLLRPILTVIAIINYIGTYGEFVLARVLLSSNDKYTLMVGLQRFSAAQFDQRWGVFAAGALLGALPIMLLYLIFQDQIIGGLTLGAVKG